LTGDRAAVPMRPQGKARIDEDLRRSQFRQLPEGEMGL
jgi:hypothetical protein